MNRKKVKQAVLLIIIAITLAGTLMACSTQIKENSTTETETSDRNTSASEKDTISERNIWRNLRDNDAAVTYYGSPNSKRISKINMKKKKKKII